MKLAHSSSKLIKYFDEEFYMHNCDDFLTKEREMGIKKKS